MQWTCRHSVFIWLSSECLSGRSQIGKLSRSCILGKDGCSRETENIVFLESLGDGHVHITELRTMALVENHHYISIGTFDFFLLFQQRRKFLNGGDNDFLRVGSVVQLFL